MTSTQPIAISAANCVEMTGMSWTWVTRFARAHDVPIWRVARKHLVPAQRLLAALESAAAELAPVCPSDEVERLKAEIAAHLRVPRRARAGDVRTRMR
jgi:hypothetical protein